MTDLGSALSVRPPGGCLHTVEGKNIGASEPPSGGRFFFGLFFFSEFILFLGFGIFCVFFVCFLCCFCMCCAFVLFAVCLLCYRRHTVLSAPSETDRIVKLHRPVVATLGPRVRVRSNKHGAAGYI